LCSSSRSKKSILLFNPWIYDFAAYDFWFKPLGLLSIAGVLRELGYHVGLVDCLDRFHPALMQANYDLPNDKRQDGSGKFLREEITKPRVLEHIPRKYCRYGMPPSVVAKILDDLEPPDVVFITSFMTYWYPAVVDAVEMIRRHFPKATVVLGGIYATLAPEHARSLVKPDFLIRGEGEKEAASLLANLSGGKGKEFNYSTLDDLPWPALDLYPDLRSAAILTSRGCPFTCSFCASRIVAPNYRRRTPGHVLQEIRNWHEQFDINQFAFFDDALLNRADEFIKPILNGVLENNWKLNFHTPNGLAPRFFDKELAQLFFASGVKTVRLSFETLNKKRQLSMSAKVSNGDLVAAIRFLKDAGFKTPDIGVYVMMGLPDQNVDEVVDSINFVHGLGATVNLVSFSPIPGTQEWANAVAADVWCKDADLLLTNTTIFPLWSKKIGYESSFEILNYAHTLNKSLRESMSIGSL
jgi:radical SAM superfamily enzyme YgiQ (UPF0313 family)